MITIHIIFKGDNEITKIVKFVKRAAETFGQNHGIQLTLTSDSGARITTGEMGKWKSL